ncbi:ATP/GTP-binding protein [Streptomyces minutiscleroticus]|uniref:ATP/GTP-binding protein n=1 Tax=Streptomyces minutiscleroticus TaxID=68238 RepID=A0A918NX52_9ACTN|nr:ATP/GTP-binding protein [Streptomyces minutiscleroticus]
MDGHATDRTRPHLLTRRLATLTGALILAAAGTALADAAPDIDAGHCQAIRFCVGVGVGGGTGPHGGQTAASGTGGGDSTVKCTLTKVDPKPPADHPAWNGADPDKSDLYFRACTDGGTANPDGFVVVGEGEDVPQVNPRELAQRAVDSMTLLGPDIASPRPAGRYTVGVPMWLWVNQSATTYGPNTASASAGGVTVTATAKVSKIVWEMGDGATVTCTGPGTPYSAAAGMKESPTCGRRYTASSAGATGGKYAVRATSTWTIDWQGGGAAGQLTEVRQSEVQVAVGELQVVR